jgi:DNA-binding LacI/PurR family transcriptional regulator
MSQVTMKTVAEHAGVTQATVSRALARHPRISQATCARVQEVARALGYVPNPYVVALMRSRRRRGTPASRPVIGLINGLDSADAWRSSGWHTVRGMFAGATDRLRARGYRYEEFWLQAPGMTAARLSDILVARGLPGILLSPLAPGLEVPALEWGAFSAVRLGVPTAGAQLPAVCNDHYLSTARIAREVHRLGYRRPGLLLRPMHRERFQGRWEAGLESARALLSGLRPVPPLAVDELGQGDRLRRWLDRYEPDVLLTPRPEEVMSHLAALGLSVPGDLGVASLSCRSIHDPVSGIWQNGALLGASAVDLLLSLMETRERGPAEQARVLMVEGAWNPGTTLRAQGLISKPARRGTKVRRS